MSLLKSLTWRNARSGFSLFRGVTKTRAERRSALLGELDKPIRTEPAEFPNRDGASKLDEYVEVLSSWLKLASPHYPRQP